MIRCYQNGKKIGSTDDFKSAMSVVILLPGKALTLSQKLLLFQLMELNIL